MYQINVIWPINGLGFGNYANGRKNCNFTMEGHSGEFRDSGKEVFSFFR